MKVTPKTRGVSTTLFPSNNTVSIAYHPWSSDSVARVIEFPKVWREDGKQYTTDSCTYHHNGGLSDEVTIRVPDGVYCCALYCDDTIERY